MVALFNNCQRLAEAGEIGELADALSVKAGRTYEKHEVPRVAAAALVSAGANGVAVLARFLERGDIGGFRAAAALRALWLTSQGLDPLKSSLGLPYPSTSVESTVRAHARVVLDDFIAASSSDARHAAVVLGLQHEEFTLRASDNLPDFNRHVLDVTRESSIVLTIPLIESWEALVASDLAESEYQSFLEEHPVFVDPLAAEVHNRKRLGIELVTDFVVRRHDSRYVVVEIEKPQDRLFTSSDDFAAPFTHASGQVLDFQGWIAENISYAQKHLPGIENPHGLLIMGRRTEMSTSQEAKLRRWLSNSKHIDVLTFDDLSKRARALHASLRRMDGSSAEGA